MFLQGFERDNVHCTLLLPEMSCKCLCTGQSRGPELLLLIVRLFRWADSHLAGLLSPHEGWSHKGQAWKHTVVLLLGFLWGSLLDGGGRLLEGSLLGFRGSSLPLKRFLFILFPSTQKPSRPIWNHLNRLDQVNLRLVVKSFGPIIATCNNISTPSKGVDITSGHSNDHKSGVSTLKESRHAHAHFS